jgi:hypothetical protein
MKDPIIIPNDHVSFFDWRQQDVFRLQNSVLNIQEELHNFGNFLDNSRLLLLGPAQIELSSAHTMYLESLFACEGVYPDQRVLYSEFSKYRI